MRKFIATVLILNGLIWFGLSNIAKADTNTEGWQQQAGSDTDLNEDIVKGKGWKQQEVAESEVMSDLVS